MRGTKFAVAAAAVVGVCSLGVAAFALDGTGDTGGTTEPTVTTEAPATTVTTVAPGGDGVTTDPSVTDPTGAGTPDAAPNGVSTVGCPEGQNYQNHGAYVSSVAHDSNRAPGDVQQAAQSECGKPLTATEPSEPETTEPESTEPATTEPATGDAPASPPAAPGNSGNAPGHNR